MVDVFGDNRMHGVCEHLARPHSGKPVATATVYFNHTHVHPSHIINATQVIGHAPSSMYAIQQSHP